MFIAQVADPNTWAGIAERLGIPFAILLMICFGSALAAVWLARNVVKPLTKAHLGFVESIKVSQLGITEQSKTSVVQNVALLESARLHQETIKKHDVDVAQRLEKIATLLEQKCPLLAEQREKEKKA